MNTVLARGVCGYPWRWPLRYPKDSFSGGALVSLSVRWTSQLFPCLDVMQVGQGGDTRYPHSSKLE